MQEFGGYVYVDGSASTSPTRGLQRAGGAVVEVDVEGRLLRAARISIPSRLPQTSQAAEHVAFAAAVQWVTREATAQSDCMGVAEAAAEPIERVLRATHQYAGILMDTHRDPRSRKLIEGVKWVRAHRGEIGCQDMRTRRYI